MSDFERLDRLRDRRGGRGKKRVGVDYSQFMHGTAALALPRESLAIAPTPARKFKVGQFVTIISEGVTLPSRIINSYWHPFLKRTVYVVACGLRQLTFTLDALIEAVERAERTIRPPMLDVNIPLLPARASVVLDYGEWGREVMPQYVPSGRVEYVPETRAASVA